MTTLLAYECTTRIVIKEKGPTILNHKLWFCLKFGCPILPNGSRKFRNVRHRISQTGGDLQVRKPPHPPLFKVNIMDIPILGDSLTMFDGSLAAPVQVQASTMLLYFTFTF